MFGLIRRLRRRRWAKEPFPEAWKDIVDARLPFAKSLGDAERVRFLFHLMVFAREKNWEGAERAECTSSIGIPSASVAPSTNHCAVPEMTLIASPLARSAP